MTFVSKYRDLVERLYEETSEGRIEWKLDDWEVDPIAKFSTYSIGLSSKTEDDEPFEVVEIHRAGGDTAIDTFDDSVLRDFVPRVGGFQNYFMLMKNLRQTATRIASGAEEALDDILEALERQKED